MLWEVSHIKLKSLLQRIVDGQAFNMVDYGTLIQTDTPIDLTELTSSEAQNLIDEYC